MLSVDVASTFRMGGVINPPVNSLVLHDRQSSNRRMDPRPRDLANTRHFDDGQFLLRSLGSFMVKPLGLINRTKSTVTPRRTSVQLTWW